MGRIPTSQLTRRTLLSLGGVSLLVACSVPKRGDPRTAEPGARKSELPGDSHPTGVPESDPVESGGRWGGPEFYVHKGARGIALTIDDGPSPEYTPEVLRLLRKYRVTATFCQVGSLVPGNRALVREVAEEGHLIANHTWTHRDLAGARSHVVREELERTSDAIERAAGQRPTLFRAPYGVWSEHTLVTCREMGMRPLDWSVDPRDWSRPGTSRIVRRVLAQTRPGSIILEHDGGGDRSETVAALRIVLPRLIDSGYHFVTP